VDKKIRGKGMVTPEIAEIIISAVKSSPGNNVKISTELVMKQFSQSDEGFGDNRAFCGIIQKVEITVILGKDNVVKSLNFSFD